MVTLSNPYSKKTFRPLIFIVLILGLGSVALLFMYRDVPTALPVQTDSIESDQYAVYSVLLKELFINENVKLLVIQKQTSYCAVPECKPLLALEERIADMRKRFSPAQEETLRNYESKNASPSVLTSNFDLPVKYILLDESELKKDKYGDRTNSFYDMNFRGASGMITLSSVGFNGDRTEAIVKAELIFCPLCSHGNTVLLKKRFGMWTVENNLGGWAS